MKVFKLEVKEGYIILDAYGTGVLALIIIIGFVVCLITGFIIGWLIK